MKDDEIRILILEDNPTDAELVEHELRKGGIVFQLKRVETRDDFISQIEEFTPQVILADYKLPAFTGMEALAIIKEKGLEVPFIIVSGTLGEDLAIETLKAGVTDYILKSNLKRLVSAVNRALAETKLATERKQAEEAIRESEERFRQMFDNMGNCVAIYEARANGEDFIFKDFNPAAEHVDGLTREKVLGRSVLKVFPGVKEFGLFEVFQRVWKTGKPESHPVGLYKDNRISGWRENFVYKLSSGEVVAIYEDITARKQAEEKLRYNLNFLNILIDTIPSPVYSKDVKGIYLSCNKNFAEQILGLPREKIIGRSLYELSHVIPRNLADIYHQQDMKLLQNPGVQVYETKVQCADGIQRDFILYKATFTGVDGKTAGIVGVMLDITERKLADEALRKSEEKYRALLETTSTGFVITDLTGKVLDANDEYARLTGHERRDEILGRSIVEWTAAYDKERNAKAVEVCVQQGFIRNFEVDYVGTKGQIIPVEINATLVTINNELKTLGLCRDITERKQAEEALQRSEDEARRFAHENAIIAEIGRIISSTLNIEEVYDRFAEEVHKLIPFDRIGINVINPQVQSTTLVYGSGHDIPGRQNGDYYLLAGSLSEELIRRRSSLLFQSEDEREWAERFPASLCLFRAGIRSKISILLMLRDQVIAIVHFESLTPQAYTEMDLRLAEKVGNQIAGAIANAQLFAEHERSEAEKANLQAQLQQSQKMEAVGQLAGGVAHDFNNLLTVISIQSQLALRGLREGDPLKERLKDVEQAADRAAGLTRQLLAFSRRQILEMKVFNPNFILTDMEKMLRRVIGEDIEFKALLADDLGLVKVDPGQMEQVIINLAVNAKDAMPQGGKLFLETANAELDEEDVRSHVGMIPGAYVLLSITDTGIGMSKEVKEKIFDPFFTTKEKGKGTGLGLSTVYGIVKQSGGDIYVDSEEGKGTTFKVYFPRVFEPQEELKKGFVEELPRGKETIVVVEDDRMVRKLAVDILRKQGYRVLEAEAGGEGLLICEQHQEPIHLILTDVIMPKMSGAQFIERLKQVRKDFKVLYMTGYTDESIVRQGILEEGINLIHKPFTIEKLARKVREVIDGS